MLAFLSIFKKNIFSTSKKGIEELYEKREKLFKKLLYLNTLKITRRISDEEYFLTKKRLIKEVYCIEQKIESISRRL